MEGGGRMRERRKEGEREERSLLWHLFFLVFEEQGENEGRGEESKNEGGEFGRVVYTCTTPYVQ